MLIAMRNIRNGTDNCPIYATKYFEDILFDRKGGDKIGKHGQVFRG